jgi:pimeloyl-ACP methyl ester carboxylesterase
MFDATHRGADVRELELRVNGLRLVALQDGPDDGSLVLCLHGFPDTAWTWRLLLPALAERGYRAVAPFSRGYAPSEASAEATYTVGDLAADVCVLHEQLGGGRPAVLVGHDWGAAAAYAALTREPSRWSGAVAVAVPPTGHIGPDLASYEQMRRSWYGFLFQLPVAEEVVARDDFEFVCRLWADWSPGFDASEELPRVKEALAASGTLTAALRYYRDSPTELRPPSAASPLPDLPLLYIHGANDGCIGIDVLEVARPFFPPQAEILVVEGAGHFVHLERPDEFEAAAVAFLERLGGPLKA